MGIGRKKAVIFSYHSRYINCFNDPHIPDFGQAAEEYGQYEEKQRRDADYRAAMDERQRQYAQRKSTAKAAKEGQNRYSGWGANTDRDSEEDEAAVYATFDEMQSEDDERRQKEQEDLYQEQLAWEQWNLYQEQVRREQAERDEEDERRRLKEEEESSGWFGNSYDDDDSGSGWFGNSYDDDSGSLWL